MTEIGTGEAESERSATAGRVSPPVEFDPANRRLGTFLGRSPGGTTHRRHRDDGANILYIDQPTIPVGMTVETYRRVRARRKPHRFRRLASLAL
jgi:hypothetical protein